MKMNSQIKKYTGCGQEPLSPGRWGASTQQHVDMLTSLEVLQSPLFRGGFGGSLVGMMG